jgi:hypothetical protein
VAASEAIAGTDTSPIRDVSAAVVDPDPTVLRKIRSTVATPVVGAEATDIKRILCTKLPLAPAVNVLKMSVPTVPPPAEDVFAAACVIETVPTLGVKENIGCVLAAMLHLFLVYVVRL